jgi:hypothetical protein
MNNKQIDALLFVARETNMVSITDVAVSVLESVGFTPDEIAVVTRTVAAGEITISAPATKKTKKAPRQNAWSRWSTDDDNLIESLWASGMTVTQISKKMKRSTASVNTRIAMLRATGSKIEYRNLGVRDARLNVSPKTKKFTLPKK